MTGPCKSHPYLTHVKYTNKRKTKTKQNRKTVPICISEKDQRVAITLLLRSNHILGAHFPHLLSRPCSQCLKKSRPSLCVYAPKKPAKKKPPKGGMAARLKRLEGMVRDMLDEEGNIKMTTTTHEEEEQSRPEEEDVDDHAMVDSGRREDTTTSAAAARAEVSSVRPASGKVVRADGPRGGGSTTYVVAMHFMAILDDVCFFSFLSPLGLAQRGLVLLTVEFSGTLIGTALVKAVEQRRRRTKGIRPSEQKETKQKQEQTRELVGLMPTADVSRSKTSRATSNKILRTTRARSHPISLRLRWTR